MLVAVTLVAATVSSLGVPLLPDVAATAIGESSAVLVGRHGALVAGATLEDALEVERQAQVALLLRAAGDRGAVAGPEACSDLSDITESEIPILAALLAAGGRVEFMVTPPTPQCPQPGFGLVQRFAHEAPESGVAAASGSPARERNLSSTLGAGALIQTPYRRTGR